MCNEQGIRIFGMLSSVFYIAFMIYTNNIVGSVCELICLFVMLASYIKYRNNNK